MTLKVTLMCTTRLLPFCAQASSGFAPFHLAAGGDGKERDARALAPHRRRKGRG